MNHSRHVEPTTTTDLEPATTPVADTARDSMSSPAAQHRRGAPMPGFLKVLAIYLLTEASIRISTATLQFTRGTSEDLREDMWHLLLGTFYLLLVPQIFVRTVAARISLSLVFLIQVLMILVEIGIRSPHAWTYLSAFGRFQILAQLIFFSVVIVTLNRRPISDAFRS